MMVMQTQRILSISAWAFLTFIVFATLSPYSLRPELTKSEPDLVVIMERVSAFGLLGLLFLLSHPDRLRTVCVLILGSAVVLELAQAFLPDRHARFADALEKIVGGGAGIVLGIALLPLLTSGDGLFSKIDQLWFTNSKAIDPDVRELVIGLFAILLFALLLVAFQNVGL